MTYRFKTSDLVSFPEPPQNIVSVEVLRKIERLHLPQLEKLKTPIKNVFGYRSKGHELLMGRDGRSQHTFTGDGAVDISTDHPVDLFLELVESDYTRIAYYTSGFFHCDYKGKEEDHRVRPQKYYLNKPNVGWIQMTADKLIQVMEEHKPNTRRTT